MDYEKVENGRAFMIFNELDKKTKINEEEYLQGMAILKASFNSLKIQRENLEIILKFLQPFSLYQFKKAINDLCQNCEKINTGTNIVALIYKTIQKYDNSPKPKGWICPKCESTVPMDKLYCRCEEITKPLTREEKIKCIKQLRELECNFIADILEKKITDEEEYGDEVPF